MRGSMFMLIFITISATTLHGWRKLSWGFVLTLFKVIWSKCQILILSKTLISTKSHFVWNLFFTYLQYKSFENTGGKGEIAHNEQYLLFPRCFLPVWRTVSWARCNNSAVKGTKKHSSVYKMNDSWCMVYYLVYW